MAEDKIWRILRLRYHLSADGICYYGRMHSKVKISTLPMAGVINVLTLLTVSAATTTAKTKNLLAGQLHLFFNNLNFFTLSLLQIIRAKTDSLE